jgi:hypothetical protein
VPSEVTVTSKGGNCSWKGIERGGREAEASNRPGHWPCLLRIHNFLARYRISSRATMLAEAEGSPRPMTAMRLFVTFGAVFLASSITAAANSSAPWQYHIGNDPMTDVLRATAATMGEQGAMALFQCEKDGDAVFLVKVQYIDIAMEPVREVVWRVDSGEPRHQTWVNVDEGAAILGAEAIQLAREIAAATERLVVCSDAKTIVFSVRGFDRSDKRSPRRLRNYIEQRVWRHEMGWQGH